MNEKFKSVEEQEIEPEDTSSGMVITQPFSPNDIKLSNPPMNLGDLIDRIQYGWIDFHTEYQRKEDLWSPGKQSRLIESAMLGLRLPAFYSETGEHSRQQKTHQQGLFRGDSRHPGQAGGEGS